MDTSIKNKVIGAFAETTGKSASELSMKTRIEEDLELKSINMFTLAAMLEGSLGSAPDADEAENLKTIGDYVEYYKK
ncbi:acyl carrier protein [Secundilactobacillus folii]|uniref:Carrier domain-containing protein n=1 Tax=Secundilactobacillus folii TaxID=2678357 RepID=A0A7X3C3Q3_9LACO|nr:phosphopantetheine-binding protein [Secundilactobacillus folii]MTV82757.1 hypothetical protein [Secundilactobacillus folii]